MAAETWSSVEQFELQVKETTHTEKRYELSLIENLLNCYLAGFRALHEFKIGEINQPELAWLLLTVRSFNSLRCAYDLLQRGYYNQAVMLVRSVEEDYLTCRHCDIDQRTIDALLTGKSKIKRFQDMANDISTKFGERWRINYGQLSELAHPRQLAIGMIATWKDRRLNLGGNYSENNFIATCQALLRSAVGMTEFIIRLLGDKAVQWQKDSLPAFQEASAYVEEISRTYGGNN